MIEDFCSYCGNPGPLEGCRECINHIVHWISVEYEMDRVLDLRQGQVIATMSGQVGSHLTHRTDGQL